MHTKTYLTVLGTSQLNCTTYSQVTRLEKFLERNFTCRLCSQLANIDLTGHSVSTNPLKLLQLLTFNLSKAALGEFLEILLGYERGS